MEKKHTAEGRQKEVQRLTIVVLVVMTVVILGYVIFGMVTDDMNMPLFAVLLGGFVVIYLALTDIVEPLRLGMFEELTPERRAGFLKVLAMDAVGAGALIYWIAGINSETGNSLLVPFLIYFLSAQMKRKFRQEFEGVLPEEEQEEKAQD